MFPTNKYLIPTASMLLVMSASSLAQTVSTTIDVYAGIRPALELECSDIHFGVWSVRSGSRGGTTAITLHGADFNGTYFPTIAMPSGAGASTTSLSSQHAAPQVSTCLVRGSQAADGTSGTVTLANTTGSVVAINNPADYAQFGNIAAPSDSSFSMDYQLTVSDPTPTITSGEARFFISGILTIPDNLGDDQWGGYKSPDSHLIEFDDGV